MAEYQFTEFKRFKNLTPEQTLHLKFLLTDAMERGFAHLDDPAFIEWCNQFPGIKPWLAEYSTAFILYVAYSLIWNFSDDE